MTASIQSVALTEATTWLALVDAGDAQRSWEATGASFRAAAPVSTWTEKLKAARGPLGTVTSRTLAVAQALPGLPGAPPGEYVIHQYHSVYSASHAVVETVTLVHETDGVWRVVGYFIR